MSMGVSVADVGGGGEARRARVAWLRPARVVRAASGSTALAIEGGAALAGDNSVGSTQAMVSNKREETEAVKRKEKKNRNEPSCY